MHKILTISLSYSDQREPFIFTHSLSFKLLGQMGGYYSPYTGGFTAAQMAAAAAAAAAQQTTQVIRLI